MPRSKPIRRDAAQPMPPARELLRYRKADRTRTYRLRTLSDGSAEIWVSAAQGVRETTSRRLMTLTDPDDTGPVLESIELDLRAGGWSRV